MGRPNQTQDRLDALLDGRPGEVSDDLAPLLAAAEALRAELADLELDPEVVDRHLQEALDRPATVVELPVPVRKVATGGGVMRRRLAAAGLAAALVLVPATAASAASSSALPGQALYPVKLAVEQFRLAAVQWSPTREAQERAKLAAERLKELNRLGELRMFRQIPSAIRALNKAVMAAQAAVREAEAEEGRASELLAASSRLEAVKDAQLVELNELTTIVSQLPLPPANQVAISLAVQESRVVAASPPALAPPPPAATAPASNTTGAQPEPPGPAPTPPPTSSPATQPEAPGSTSPTTTDPPTTTAPTTTAPTTTAAPEGTPGVQGSPAGADGGSPPSSTLP